MKRRATLSIGLATAAACALVIAGCLGGTPAPATGYVGDDVTPPQDASVGVEAPLDASDAALDAIVLAAWDGTWTFTSGSEGLECVGSLSAVAVTGVLMIAPASSGRALTVEEDGCSFAFALAGTTATSEPNQACAAWSVPTIPDWTLTMQANGTLKEKLGGQVWLDGEPCEISGGSTLVRQ